MLGHKQVFESAIVAGNKLFAADDTRIRKIAGTVPDAPGNRQHNSRPAQLGFFKFPDKNAGRGETEYGADNF